jgi:hypothetical protein
MIYMANMANLIRNNNLVKINMILLESNLMFIKNIYLLNINCGTIL